jgi:hypothetical protein
MPRTRKGVTVICIALIIFGAFVPASPTTLAELILVPLWIVLPDVAVTIVRREAFRCDEQLAPLLAILDSRAPPTSPLL